MKAIRGAITLNGDTEKEVRENVKFLLGEIVSANKLIAEDVICIMFSNTSDIRSFYPAKAAREAGFFNCALYSSLEPEINGSLPYCIRVMILAEITAKPKHIYLKGASDLRKDITQKLNIAIDGLPAAEKHGFETYIFLFRYPLPRYGRNVPRVRSCLYQRGSRMYQRKRS